MGAECRYPVVGGHTHGTRVIPIGDVELHQCLTMLGDEGDRYHHDWHAVAASPLDFLGDRGFQPGQRPHLALVADCPVQRLLPQSGDDPPRGLLHLPLIGIAACDHALGQAVG